MKIGELTDYEKREASSAADTYFIEKQIEPIDTVRGFIETNHLVGLTTKEIDALITSAEKLSGGTILGDGDKFKAWCGKNGRVLPSDDLVRLMNGYPHIAREEIVKLIPTDVGLWRAYCSYRAGRGL
jgi:hypothetical protein